MLQPIPHTHLTLPLTKKNLGLIPNPAFNSRWATPSMLWETTTTTFNTIDELDQVIHTGVNTSSPQSAGIGASQHVHLKCRAPDLVNSSSRTHYRSGLNCMEGKHLGKDSEARTKIICPVQPFQLPHPPATFKSTLAFQNLPTHHHHLKSRRSMQP